MYFFDAILTYIIPFLLILTVLVFVHEMGHFIVARRNGVRVEVFSIGFGPEIVGWTDRARTRWKISLIPLGGYVKMFGDANAASQPAAGAAGMSEEDRAVAFPCKGLGPRTRIVLAGPAANFLFAILLLAGLFATVGQPFTPPVVGEVTPGSAAEAAGILAGDRIVELDGEAIERFEEIQRIVRGRAGRALELALQRNGERLVVTAVPRLKEFTDNFGTRQRIGLLGITRTEAEFLRHGPVMAIWRAGLETLELSRGTLVAVGEIIAGSRGSDELGGPVRIAQMSGMVVGSGIVAVIWFMAVLSINLGLINLFPIPMLDGGHLLFYAIEAVRGRPLGERAQEFGFRIGVAIVFSLMLFVTLNDLVQLEVFDFLTRLIT